MAVGRNNHKCPVCNARSPDRNSAWCDDCRAVWRIVGSRGRDATRPEIEVIERVEFYRERAERGVGLFDPPFTSPLDSGDEYAA